MINQCNNALKSTDWSTESLQRVKNDFPKKHPLLHPETDLKAKKRKSQTSVAELEEDSRSSTSASRKTSRKKTKTSGRTTAPPTMDSLQERENE
ncbi:hypothetical protein VKT23_016531 [Stygiomarasmius scandens]|uniref:Uncharacterized protein n=1 Tax=Marasmiellus scandens TaxID=2682957 RepID=A0ABR1IYY6_9AGAR